MSKFISIIVCIIFKLLKDPQEAWDLGLQRSNSLELIANYADLEASSIPGIYEYQSVDAYDSWPNLNEHYEQQTVSNNNNDEALSNPIPGDYVYIRNSRVNDRHEPNILHENDEEVSNPIPGSYVYIEEEDDYYSAGILDNDEEEIPSDVYDSSSDEDDRDSWSGLQTDWSEQHDNSNQGPRLLSEDGSYERDLNADEPHLITDEEDEEEDAYIESIGHGERGVYDNDGGIWNNDSSSSDDEDDRDSWDGLPSDGGFI